MPRGSIKAEYRPASPGAAAVKAVKFSNRRLYTASFDLGDWPAKIAEAQALLAARGSPLAALRRLVRQGMMMKIVPTAHLDWPPPYKEATERYSPRFRLQRTATSRFCRRPAFPARRRQRSRCGRQVMWNFAFRPLYTDDLDQRGVEAVSRRAGSPRDRAFHVRSPRLLQLRRTHRGRADADGPGRF